MGFGGTYHNNLDESFLSSKLYAQFILLKMGKRRCKVIFPLRQKLHRSISSTGAFAACMSGPNHLQCVIDAFRRLSIQRLGPLRSSGVQEEPAGLNGLDGSWMSDLIVHFIHIAAAMVYGRNTVSKSRRPGQSHETVLSEKYPLHFCHRAADAERSEADAERSMHFFDSAMLFFMNFTSVSSADLGKKVFMRSP